MNDDTVDKDKFTLVPREFNQKPVFAIPFEGDVFFIVVQIELALGYSPFALAKLFNGRWRDQIQPGLHVQKLQNGRLESFKEVIGIHFRSAEVDPKTSHLLVLTKKGLRRVLTLSNKPLARRFQEWLDEVLDQIEIDGRYDPARQVEAGQLVGSPAPAVEAPPPTPPRTLARPPRRPRHEGPPTPADVAQEALYGLHRGGAVDRGAYEALRGLIDQLAGQGPAAPSGSTARRLTGPVESSAEARSRRIAEAMAATGPKGPHADGPMREAVANCLYYAGQHEADYAAGRINARVYVRLMLQIVDAWAIWRVCTGEIDALSLLGDVRGAVERACGPVPGLA